LIFCFSYSAVIFPVSITVRVN